MKKPWLRSQETRRLSSSVLATVMAEMDAANDDELCMCQLWWCNRVSGKDGDRGGCVENEAVVEMCCGEVVKRGLKFGACQL